MTTNKRFTIKEIDNFNYGIKVTDVIMDDEIELPQSTVCDLLNELADESEQLKQQVTHLTMYKNLFREFQKQLDGVKKKSDLDHKDFEDLIELTKGHVFDDEHGWIWLPVNDR